MLRTQNIKSVKCSLHIRVIHANLFLLQFVTLKHQHQSIMVITLVVHHSGLVIHGNERRRLLRAQDSLLYLMHLPVQCFCLRRSPLLLDRPCKVALAAQRVGMLQAQDSLFHFMRLPLQCLCLGRSTMHCLGECNVVNAVHRFLVFYAKQFSLQV